MYELDFWILWITYAINSAVAVLVIYIHKFYGLSLAIHDNKLVFASALGAFFNGTGRILWGYLNDKFNFKILMCTLTAAMSVMLSTFYICTIIRDENLKIVMYSIWVIVLHFLLSGNFSLFPAICVKTFGTKNFAGNYGLLFTAYSFGGILSSALSTGLLEKGQHPIAYLTPFLICSGLSFLSCLTTFFYRGRSLLYGSLSG